MNRDPKELARVRTMQIQGKPYATVPARVEAFWAMCPGGSIETTPVVLEPDWCAFRATVRDENGQVIATGHAFEVKNAGKVNPTSYIENCETSAVGRALGLAGIGSADSIASAEEMLGALSQQDKPAQQPAQVSRKAAQEITNALEKRFLELSRQAVKTLSPEDMEALTAEVKLATGKKFTEYGPEEYKTAVSIIEARLGGAQ